MDGLTPGTYMLSFTDGPQDLVGAEPREITITDGQQTDLKLPETPAPATLVIAFQTGDGTPVTAEGACVTIEGSQYCDNDANDREAAAGTITVGDLAPGNYTIQLDNPPTGYTLPGENPVQALGAGQTATVPVTVALATTGFTVRTVDAADTNVALPDACYSVDGGAATACDADDGTSDGITTFADVTPGDHTVTQTQAPAGYDLLPEDQAQTQTVAADGTTQFVFENTASVGTVQITTRIAGGGDVLTGACYAIDGGDPVCDADDGSEDGVVTFADLRVGTYTFTQTTAPAGYEPAAAIVDVSVVAGLNQLTVENIAQTGTVITQIVDEGGQPLGGACVTIQGVGDRCDGGTEDADTADGTIQTNGVALGAHDVTVLSVPDGYDVPQGAQVANVTVDSPATRDLHRQRDSAGDERARCDRAVRR